MTAYLRRPRQIRSAFTVVELLVVITVIAILTAILVPVVGSAYKRANEFAIQNEMSQLDQAIEQFKIKYGFYPPRPIMIILLGLVVLFIVTALFMPLIQIISGLTGKGK